ncbi:MAG: PRC-barrel domain-containing protein [Microcoleus vaginatus WJT46-NPBG5]|jgi:sporulation protein YlmC with PRC-barrel domain|nr:PRC-barrel domain-containing protein [Microcoleus vaginatus WJT46-NPBG5]
MTSEQIRQRSDLLNTQVITRTTGKRLGVVKELLVDIDRREVVALGLRDNLLSVAGMPRFMLLTSIRQMGDVILVEDENVIEDIDVDSYSSLIGSEVITETGELLGKVRGFKFNTETGTVVSLILASIGVPLIPDQVISTYELPIEEIISSGPNRLIVFEGAEERLVQLTVGVLERLGIGQAPWEREEEETYYAPVARPENQLGTGIPLRTPEPIRKSEPVVQPTWDEDDWEESQPEPIIVRPSLRQQPSESIYYEEDLEEEENWREASVRDEYEEEYDDRDYTPAKSYEEEYDEDYEYEDIEADAWADDESPKPYQAPRVNIPEKTKMPEYEEEPGY